jgi:hypothetical protein
VPLLDLVQKQLEYYFSNENLVKDMYLRKLMDTRGYVPFYQLLSFSRLRTLTASMHYLALAARRSTHLKVKQGGIRRRSGWQQFTFPPQLDKLNDPDSEDEKEDSHTLPQHLALPLVPFHNQHLLNQPPYIHNQQRHNHRNQNNSNNNNNRNQNSNNNNNNNSGNKQLRDNKPATPATAAPSNANFLLSS